MQIRPFHFDFTEQDIAEFQEGAANVLRSGNLILGEYTRRFEEAFARFVGVKHAISVNSGSSALEFLMRIKQIEGKTVLVPTNTNFATVAAILRAGGVVHYLDNDPTTFSPSLAMVEQALARAKNVAGVLWVHIGGVISPEFPNVVRHCHPQGLWVVEDAAHAHGSQINGVQAGALADAGAFSFFPTKLMTTCEGGMITTNSAEEDYAARSFRNQGKRGMNFGGLHHDFGNSSRITELGAVMGLIQLKRLPEMIAKREAGYRVIARHLDAAGIRYVSTAHMDRASQYKLIVLLPAGLTLEAAKQQLGQQGVVAGGGVYEIPCHLQPVFAGVDAGRELPLAERWCPNHICPPLTSAMTEEQANFVGESLVQCFAAVRSVAIGV